MSQKNINKVNHLSQHVLSLLLCFLSFCAPILTNLYFSLCYLFNLLPVYRSFCSLTSYLTNNKHCSANHMYIHSHPLPIIRMQLTAIRKTQYSSYVQIIDSHTKKERLSALFQQTSVCYLEFLTSFQRVV